MSCSGDIVVTSTGTKLHLGCFPEQYFSVNSPVLDNSKSYNRDFFTIDTIDDGLSFGGIQSILSLDNICIVPYTMFGSGVLKEKASWSDQRPRINRE